MGIDDCYKIMFVEVPPNFGLQGLLNHCDKLRIGGTSTRFPLYLYTHLVDAMTGPAHNVCLTSTLRELYTCHSTPN